MKQSVVALTLVLSSAAFAAPKYHSLSEIPIKGQGGWDALTVDSDNHRLFVSHFDRVVVIDTKENKVIKEITGTLGVHAIALAPDLKKAYSSDGKANSVSVIDLDKLEIKTKIKVGENPDAIVYVANTNEVYAFNGKSNSASVINAKTDKVIATIALPGKPEFAVVDENTHRVYLNIEDKNSIVGIDTQTHKIATQWNIEGCESPSGIAIDAAAKRILTVCENERMVMIDATNGKILAAAPTGSGTDGAAFDPELKLAFSSNGKSATLSVIHVTGEKLSTNENVKTQMGARTIAIDPKTHRVYMPTADFQPATAGQRPKPVDGTQRVLVYGFN